MRWAKWVFGAFILVCAIVVAVSAVVVAARTRGGGPRHRTTTLKVRQLHSGPSIFYVGNFANPDECAAVRGLLDVGRARYRALAKSAKYYPVLRSFVRRFAGITNLPMALISVSHIYVRSPGKKQSPHVDYLPRTSPEFRKRGQRVWTLVVGLSRASGKSGQFHFPAIGRKVSLKLGDAVAWRNTTLAGVDDKDTLHGQLPLARDAAPRWYVVLYGRSLHSSP